MSIALNPNKKNQFKFQVVMQQNWEKRQGG
jgi:hypothetical protein